MTSLHRTAFSAWIICCAALSLPTLANTPAVAPAHCQDSAYRQFDFWLGDWDTYRIGAANPSSVARNRVTAILGGCVLHEVYQRTDGYTGESYTIYDAARKRWHQSWVTNEGELLVAEGTQQGKQIVLTGSTYDAKGETLHKVSWEPTAEGVRETATASSDGGKTWAPEFDIMFRKHG
ncbi:hypothetical protein [Dyella silvatica]|uniref:hypothetical protein n=1 Tax=Dyella silvatica TaxID=2992128 RepID=UPI00224D4480|nr:hypothetical protein [Dyella silvatica]